MGRGWTRFGTKLCRLARATAASRRPLQGVFVISGGEARLPLMSMVAVVEVVVERFDWPQLMFDEDNSTASPHMATACAVAPAPIHLPSTFLQAPRCSPGHSSVVAARTGLRLSETSHQQRLPLLY